MKAAAITAAAAAVLATGCATVKDPVTGAERMELTPAGQVAVGLLAVGALVALGGAASDEPRTTYVTTYPDGRRTTTEVYDR